MNKYNPHHRKQYSGIISNFVNDNDNFHSLSSSIVSNVSQKVIKSGNSSEMTSQQRRASIKKQMQLINKIQNLTSDIYIKGSKTIEPSNDYEQEMASPVNCKESRESPRGKHL